MRRAFFFHLARPLSFLKELCNCGLEHVENELQKNRIYVQLTSASFVISLKGRHRAAWEAALPQSGTALRRPGTEISFVDLAWPPARFNRIDSVPPASREDVIFRRTY